MRRVFESPDLIAPWHLHIIHHALSYSYTGGEGGVPLLHPVDDDDYENNSDHDDDVHGVISNVVDNGIFKCSNERYTTAASSFCYCC